MEAMRTEAEGDANHYSCYARVYVYSRILFDAHYIQLGEKISFFLSALKEGCLFTGNKAFQEDLCYL